MTPALLYVVVLVPDAAAAPAAFEALSSAAASHGGCVLAAAALDEVDALETGTPRAAVFVARWSEREAFDRYWSEVAPTVDSVAGIAGSRAVLLRGFPAEGLPGDALPTVATVRAPDGAGAPAYMLIQGTVTDRAAMQAYSAIVVPMLRERQAYYLAQARAPDVAVLFGEWREHAFLISRWPDVAAGRGFWWSDRYQDVAKPARAGAGSFRVLLVPGVRG